MLTVQIKDKNNVDYLNASFNEKLVIAPAGKGEIFINARGREFGLHEILIGPPGLKCKIDVYIDLNPSLTANTWMLMRTTTRTGSEATVFEWISDEMYTAKNAVKIEITNNEAADKDFYYFVPCSPQGQIPNRKF